MAEQIIPPPARAGAMSLTRAQRWRTFWQGVIFVAGFATFVVGVFGFVGTLLGDVFYDLRDGVRAVGGIAR